MTTSVVCGGCGAAVSYGRLSCPECGELLATVAGVGRRSMSGAASVAVAVEPTAAPVTPEPVASGPDPLASLMSAVREAGQATPVAPVAPIADPNDPLDEALPLELPWAPVPAAAVAGADHGLDAILEPPAAATAIDPLDVAFPAFEDEAAPAWPADQDDAIDDDVLAATAGLPAWPPAPASAAVEPEPESPAWPPPSAAVASPGPAAPAWPSAPVATATPGAYVPPIPMQPAGAAAPARAWAGYSADPGMAVAGGAAVASANGHASSGAASPPDPVAEPGAKAASVIDLAQANEFVGWLAIAGSMLAIVGFVLPWSNITVIGATGVGYLDRWGLAGPWHVLVLAGVVGMLVAAIMRDRVPTWVGIGLPGLGLGALLLGLVWPYLVGPLGGSLGAMAVALGAVMCVAAGIATLVVDRHARLDQGV